MEKSSAFKSISYQEAKIINPSFLFIVHNNTEYDIMLDSLAPPPDYDKIAKVVVECQPYYIGNFGAQTIVVVKSSDMGSTKPFASTTTTINAITHWQPLFVLMVGVAASMEKKNKAKIGDVIVARESIDYQSAKYTDEGPISRAHHYYSGKIYKMFDNIRSEEFNAALDNDTNEYKIKKGAVLSGGILLDSKTLKKELRDLNLEVVGLEMEFMGVASACIDAGINQLIMVKGICDFGDGTKKYNKGANQKKAMQNAIKLCKIVFDDPHNFSNESLKYAYSNVVSKSVFIAGSHDTHITETSAKESGVTSKYVKCEDAIAFAAELSMALQESGYRIVTGYGREIGQAVVAGALSNISMHENSYIALQEKIVTMPFPRLQDCNYYGLNYDLFKTKYREIMCREANYVISVFGVKSENKNNEAVEADGVEQEVDLAHSMRKLIIPVGATEFTSRKIWEKVKKELDMYYPIKVETNIDIDKKRELRDECFRKLGEEIDFQDKLQRKNLIDTILLFLKTPWIY